MSTLLQAAGGFQAILGSPIFMFVIIIAIMYFMMIRPQQKRQKEIKNFRNSLTVGQNIITNGGIYEKVAGTLPFNIKETTPEELTEYFAGILPDYDKERVYLTHIKKIYSWYNILVAGGVTDFGTPEETAEETETKEAE